MIPGAFIRSLSQHIDSAHEQAETLVAVHGVVERSICGRWPRRSNGVALGLTLAETGSKFYAFLGMNPMHRDES